MHTSLTLIGYQIAVKSSLFIFPAEIFAFLFGIDSWASSRPIKSAKQQQASFTSSVNVVVTEPRRRGLIRFKAFHLYDYKMAESI